MSDDVREEHLELKKFLNEHVYQHHRVQRMTSKARRVISQLFEAFLNDPKLLPPEHRVPAGEVAAAVLGVGVGNLSGARCCGLHRGDDGSVRDIGASEGV